MARGASSRAVATSVGSAVDALCLVFFLFSHPSRLQPQSAVVVMPTVNFGSCLVVASRYLGTPDWWASCCSTCPRKLPWTTTRTACLAGRSTVNLSVVGDDWLIALGQLKTVLELYDLEIHQKISKPDY